MERERKLQLEVWKKRVSFAVTTGFQDNISYQQCIELPRAIATPDGKPIKGAKAKITKVYKKRYENATPKYLERLHRDEQNQIPDDHSCGGFSADMVIPPKWRQNVINCRKCKRNLVCFLSEFILQRIRYRLNPTQKFVTAGGLEGDHAQKAMFVTRQTPPTVDERLTSNAEESDTRIWLHVLHSGGTRKLVLSPDTDVCCYRPDLGSQYATRLFRLF